MQFILLIQKMVWNHLLTIMKCRDSIHWKDAMDEQIRSVYKNNTWRITRTLLDHKVIKCKWVYKLKVAITSKEQPKFKLWMVAKSFTQMKGVNYY